MHLRRATTPSRTRAYTSPRLNRNQFGANIGGPVFFRSCITAKTRRSSSSTGNPGTPLKARHRNYDRAAGGIRRAIFGDLRTPARDTDHSEGSARHRHRQATSFPRSHSVRRRWRSCNSSRCRTRSNGYSNFATTAASAVSHQKNYTARIDHIFSQARRFSGRYVFNDTYEAGTPIWGHDERNNLGRTQNVVSSLDPHLQPDH